MVGAVDKGTINIVLVIIIIIIIIINSVHRYAELAVSSRVVAEIMVTTFGGATVSGIYPVHSSPLRVAIHQARSQDCKFGGRHILSTTILL